MVDRPVTLIQILLVCLQIPLVLWPAYQYVRSRPQGTRRTLLFAALGVFVCVLLVGFAYNAAFVRRRSPLPYYLGESLRSGVTLWLAASGAGVLLARATGWVGKRIWAGRKHDPGRRRMLRAAQTLAAVTPAAVVAHAVFVTRRNVLTVEAELRVRGLPSDLEGLRIVQISDIHLSPTMSRAELARIIDQANELRPHLSVVTGDLVTKWRDPIEECLQELARLRADGGVFGCLGNHEKLAGVESKVVRDGARLGMQFLRYEARRLRFGDAELNVAGVDYESTSARSRYLEQAADLVVPGGVNLLLSHNPDVIGAAAEKGFQVTLSGHTHGGQVTLEFLHPWGNVARYYTPYVYGRYDVDRDGRFATSWVTRGVGTIVVPARAGAPPEIAHLRLRRAESTS